ncbi:MAG: phosphotransferase [Rhodothermales bacterium]|nr:phosphotransferase [Rhodothermales bacterium]
MRRQARDTTPRGPATDDNGGFMMLPPHELHLAERDAVLPGLRVLLDADAVRDLLESRTGESFEGLRRMYVRYKPGMNLLVGYGRDGAIECYAKTFREADRVKLDKVRERDAFDDDRFARFVIEDPAIVLAPFPADAKLPALSRLHSDRGMRHLARMAKVKRRRLTVERLRYKPERRFVGQIRERDIPVASFKTYTDRGFERARKGLQVAHGRNDVKTPDVLAIAPRLRTILFRWVSGRSLHDRLLEGSWPVDGIEAVGGALSRLHTLPPEGLSVWSTSRIGEFTAEARAAIEVLMPGRAGQLDRLVQRALAGIVDAPGSPRFLHGDFNAEQIILTERDVHFLDFDRSAAGRPQIDLATFAAHLELDTSSGQIDAAGAEHLLHTLVDGYRREGGEITADFSALTSLVLLQLALTPFRRGEPDWHDGVGSILDRCEKLLENPAARRHSVLSRTSSRERSSAGDRQTDITDAAEAADAALLTKALDADHMHLVFARLSNENPSHPALPSMASARLLKRRAGRRFVVEYNGPDPRRDVVGKVRVKGLDRRSFDVTTKLHDLGFRADGNESFAVPEPVATVPELHMSLYRRIDDRSSSSWIESSSAPSVAAQIGRSLARLHLVEPLTKRTHTLDDELTILTDRLGRFEALRPDDAKRVRRIGEAARRLFAGLSVQPVRGIHRDFHPDNIIVDRERIYFIDFDLYAVGDAAIDAGNFVGHIVEWSLRRFGHEHALDSVCEAFCQSYLAHGGPSDYDRIQSFAALTMARHIHLSTTRSGRAHITEKLISSCEARLGPRVTAA